MKIYIVDAFTNVLFRGNPAAVCPLEAWLPDATMQSIAAENNLSETAFFVPDGDHFQLRWFTPVSEVDLCGHATLASAHVLAYHLSHPMAEMRFQTKSGWLTVQRTDDGFAMNLPTDQLKPESIPPGFQQMTGLLPEELYKGKDDYLAVFTSQHEIEEMAPDFQEIARLDARGLIVTARGIEVDFVSRCFYPAYGINEDPVTGSAHSSLTAYWAEKMLKNTFTARQLSRRGGEIRCKYLGPRVELQGSCVTYLTGDITI